uniref:Acetyl-CoA hydrolase n=1 Tax=Macrostomum lignano TaxID=282301 RepID=A0A1I8FWV4_9PLAT
MTSRILLRVVSDCAASSLPLLANRCRGFAHRLSRWSHTYASTLHTQQEPFHPIPNKYPVWLNADQVFDKLLDSNQKIFIHGGAATPAHLIERMVEAGKRRQLSNIGLIHIHTEGEAPYNEPDCDGIFRSNSLFTSSNCRSAIQAGRADFTPIFLSEIPLLFRRGFVQLDVALIMVTPPDRHGFCSLGPSVDCTRAAIQNARYIVAQVNPKLPRTRGDASIHCSHIDCMVHMPQPMHELAGREINPEEQKIGKLIADNLVANGATLQTGIGSIPDAVLGSLTEHKELGVHTEMFSDGVVDLTEAGAITNSRKKIKPGKIVTGFVIGTNKVFNFIDDNAMVELCDIQFVNQVSVINLNPRVTAINSCIEIDLTGQVVSDSIGSRIYSGVGGQMDFIRGAALSTDGLGCPSSRCSPPRRRAAAKFLKLQLITKLIHCTVPGAGVVTTRAHVHYVVTEYGIAQLWGKNLRQRAHHLVQIAHPDHREALEKAAYERLGCMPSAD